MNLFGGAPFDKENYTKGIKRLKKGKLYSYYYIKNNKKVTEKHKKRIDSLGIPQNHHLFLVNSLCGNSFHC